MRTIDNYLKLPYHIEVIRDDDKENPGWAARVVELPGCITQGETFEELGEMIEDAMRGWIGIALEDGIPVPEPAPDEDYSGKFVVRLPRSLHRQLAETAEREGVSLNQFVNVALARAVERTNPAITYPIAEKSLQFSVKEKKAKYRATRKKK
ncbi:MAG: type II toxin-antitoxin system HicB family antitoxin [Anaerolineae bacterium]|nr:type II toxin-antitoxin system HicB family antitoxin [Anaerolineae bacterium]MCI0608990.1 type II toxin-antitoxin system HicB family antitoxin [Anaerolineae bacterium]